MNVLTWYESCAQTHTMNVRALILTSALALSISLPAFAKDEVRPMVRTPENHLGLTVPLPDGGKVRLTAGGPKAPWKVLDPRSLSLEHTTGKGAVRTMTVGTDGLAAGAAYASERPNGTPTPSTRNVSLQGKLHLQPGKAQHTGAVGYSSTRPREGGGSQSRDVQGQLATAVAKGPHGLVPSSDGQLKASEDIVAPDGTKQTNSIGVEHQTSPRGTTARLAAGTVHTDADGEQHAQGFEIDRAIDGDVSTKLVKASPKRTRVVEVGNEHKPAARRGFRGALHDVKAAIVGEKKPAAETFKDGLPRTN
jgi:hypothetical protein